MWIYNFFRIKYNVDMGKIIINWWYELYMYYFIEFYVFYVYIILWYDNLKVWVLMVCCFEIFKIYGVVIYW